MWWFSGREPAGVECNSVLLAHGEETLSSVSIEEIEVRGEEWSQLSAQ